VRYTPALETQLDDGGPCPAKDCVACCGATLAKAASCGRWDITGPQIRRKAGVSCYSGTGGLTYEKMAYGVRELTNGEVMIRVYYRRTREQARDALLAGASGAFSIRYRTLLGTRYASSSTYTEGHGVVLNDYRQIVNDPDLVQLGDPLADGRRASIPDGWQWAPASLIWRAAEARSAQFGSSGITMALAPDTENVIRRARVDATLRKTPHKDAIDIERLEKDHFYRCLGTANGGAWTRDTDGGTSRGWWKVKLNSGLIGWARGEALVPV
jgi:hypothetical protein